MRLQHSRALPGKATRGQQVNQGLEVPKAHPGSQGHKEKPEIQALEGQQDQGGLQEPWVLQVYEGLQVSKGSKVEQGLLAKLDREELWAILDPKG
jgi:hypothetical protein